METIEEVTETYLISRNSKTFESGFINCLTDKCTSCMLYFPKFEAVKVSFPKCLKCFGFCFREVKIMRKHFDFQKGFKFQISEVEYVTVTPIAFKWNI